MRDQFVGFFECGFVEQELDALAGRHFAFFVLLFAALLATAVFGEVVALLQFSQFLFEVHGGRIIAGWRESRKLRGDAEDSVDRRYLEVP